MTLQITVALPNAGTSDGHYNLNSFPFLYEGKNESVVVRVTRKWEEFNFMFTHEVTNVDLVIVDTQWKKLVMRLQMLIVSSSVQSGEEIMQLIWGSQFMTRKVPRAKYHVFLQSDGVSKVLCGAQLTEEEEAHSLLNDFGGGDCCFASQH